MTPARFDALYQLRRGSLGIERINGDRTRALRGGFGNQAQLTRTLGLHRSTVSKMLRRLEEMGWITRTGALHDRRSKNIRLTELGLRRIWHAMRRVFRGRILLRAYEEFFGQERPDVHVLEAIDQAFLVLWALAKRFGDRATLTYDWGAEIDH